MIRPEPFCRTLLLIHAFILGVVWLAFVAVTAAAAGFEERQITPRGADVEIQIEIANRDQLELLTRLVGIDDVRGTRVWATATPAQLEGLRAAGFAWREIDATKAGEIVMCPEGWEEDNERSWSCYPTWDQYVALMYRFASTHPGLCRLVDLGPTTNTTRPHRLLAVVVSDNPGAEEAEPEVFLTSTIHGNETAGFVLMLRLIDHLLSSYPGDGEVRDLVDSTEIWINPLANPDGTYYGGDNSVEEAIRFYTTSTGADSGVDGNRNFPDPTGDNHPDGHAWWRETQTMMNLAASENFSLSAGFHGGAEVVNYPWDTWQRRHPDDAWFESLSRDYANLAQSDSPGGYLTYRDNGITNGYDWYQTFGSRQDYLTYFYGGREVTIELSNTKLLPSDELDALWDWNRRALVDFIAHAHSGIRGIITGPYGHPLAATVEVVGVDNTTDGSTVRTDPDVGDYHRLLLPGLYDLRISAPELAPLLVEGIAVSEGAATVVDVTLYPGGILRPTRRIAPE